MRCEGGEGGRGAGGGEGLVVELGFVGLSFVRGISALRHSCKNGQGPVIALTSFFLRPI